MALASFLMATLGVWLWTGFAAPPVARSFGQPMLSGWRLDRRNRYLSKPDYVGICGVFAVGSELFVLLTLRAMPVLRIDSPSTAALQRPTLVLS